MENILNTLTIILSALSLMFAIFTAFIALLIFLGWRSVRDLDRRTKGFVARQRQIISDTEKQISQNRKKIYKFINEFEGFKNKIKSPRDFKKYEKKAGELINKLQNAVKEAEDRVSDLKVSNISGMATILPTDELLSKGTFPLYPSTNIKVCKVCGNLYSESTNIMCPRCGSIN